MHVTGEVRCPRAVVTLNIINWADPTNIVSWLNFPRSSITYNMCYYKIFCSCKNVLDQLKVRFLFFRFCFKTEMYELLAEFCEITFCYFESTL